MTFDVRLVAYEPNGARLAPLPDTLDLAAGLPLGDVSSLTLTHSDLLRGSAFLGRPLGQGLEVALEVTTGAGWVEPAGCRFVRLEQSRAVTDDHLVRKVTLPSYAWMLRKMRLLSLANLNADGKRPFLSATAGTILRTLIQESQARGTVTGLGIDFTTALDSSGAAWSKIITIYYAPGIDVWTVLDNLAAQGVVDWTMQGRTLRVFNPDSALAVDRSTGGNPVTLHLGRDVIDAPQSESLTDVVSTVLVRGEGSLAITETNAAAPSPWGAWEGYIEQGGVSDEGTARTLVQGELERGSRVRGEYTRDLTLDSATWLPMVHYAPGDYILAPGGDGGRERLRVRQVTLTRDSNGIASGNVVLNDRLVEAEIRRAKRTAGIVGGSSAGGSGSRPSPEGPDKRTPAAPLGLVVDSNAYLDSDGAARGRLSALWDAVTTANDGSALEVAGYEVSTRRDVVGAPWGQITATEATNATAFAFDVGSTWLVRVRALGRYTTSPGDWSAAVSITIASDSTPPPTPSTPALTTRLGTVSVRWDGLAAAGGTGMPVDFSHVEVLQGAGGSPTLIGSLSEPGALPVTGLPYNTPTTFRLRSVDRSGNTSPMSVAASIETAPLVDTDVIGEVISGANLMDGSVTASEKIVGGTITGALIQGLTIQADHVAANAITADKIQAGSITAEKVQAGAIASDKITLGSLSTNLLRNPSFEDTGQAVPTPGYPSVVPGWTLYSGAHGGSPVFEWGMGRQGASGSGLAVVRNNGAGVDGSSLLSALVPIATARQYRLSAWVRSAAGFPLQFGLYLRWLNAAGALLSTTGVIGAAAPTSWTQFGQAAGPFTPPAGAAFAQVQIHNNGRYSAGTPSPSGTDCQLLADDLALLQAGVASSQVTGAGIRMWDGNGVETVVIDGAGALIRAGRIEGEAIAANAITADKISADAITGKTITGGTINGTQVNSSAGLSIGAGGVIYFANTDGYVSEIRGFKAVSGAGSGVTIDATYLKAGRPFFETGATTSAANLRQGVAGGEVLRATSRRAFKLEREEIEADYRILDLPGRTWRDRGEVEQDPTTERRHAGFVAEDLATISALAGGAFDSLLDTDDDGRPTGIAYDRVTAFLLPIVRDLSERLAALEAAARD